MGKRKNMKKSFKSFGKKMLAGALMASFVFAGFTPAVANAESATETDGVLQELVIRDNVYINGVDMGGKSYEEAVAAIGTADSLKDVNVDITSQYGDVSMTLGQLGVQSNTEEIVKDALKLGNTGNILKRYKEAEDLKSNSVELDIERTINEDAMAQILDSNLGDAMNGETTYVLNKSDDGSVSVRAEGESVGIDYSATKAAIEELINENGYSGSGLSTSLVLDDEAGNGRLEQIARIKDLLGTFTTNYGSSDSGRKTNIERAGFLMNGTVLFPGEQVSVYNKIAPLEVSNGYATGHAYVGTKIVDSTGGGVCQVATTLYNAALRAEIEVLERHCHSMRVSYVDIAFDAAVAGGGVLDLKLKNTLDAPIYIECYTDGSSITFNIFGEEYRPSNRKIEFKSYYSTIYASSDPIMTEDKSLEPGEQMVVEPAVNGYSGELWKYVYVDGVETESVQINSTHHQASPAIVAINTDPPEEEEGEEGEEGETPPEGEAPPEGETPPADPSTEAPATEAPATEAPATEAPATEAPATEAPATEAPATEAPATEAPATEAPATEAPATEAPATEAPTE